MTTLKETQALIAKEITISIAGHLKAQPASASSVSSLESANAFIRTEVCKLYEEVFNTVKRLTEE